MKTTYGFLSHTFPKDTPLANCLSNLDKTELMQKNKLFYRNKRGIVSEYLPWMLIALVVLAIVLISIFTLKGKGISFIDQIKDLFRGR